MTDILEFEDLSSEKLGFSVEPKDRRKIKASVFHSREGENDDE